MSMTRDDEKNMFLELAKTCGDETVRELVLRGMCARMDTYEKDVAWRSVDDILHPFCPGCHVDLYMVQKHFEGPIRGCPNCRIALRF